VSLGSQGGEVVVEVVRSVGGPGGALDTLPGAEVRSESTALVEQ
jgi:hypothetical protein